MHEIKICNRYFKITVVVPAIILEDNTTSEMESNLSLDALQSEEKSRRFSQLPPGLSLSFYPNFLLILSKSYPDNIGINEFLIKS